MMKHSNSSRYLDVLHDSIIPDTNMVHENWGLEKNTFPFGLPDKSLDGSHGSVRKCMSSGCQFWNASVVF